MATKSVKSMNDAIIVEKITVVTGGSSTTYYKDFTKAVSKSGYTAIGIVGLELSLASCYCYWQYIESGTIHIGIAKPSETAISGLAITAHVLWIRSDLL